MSTKIGIKPIQFTPSEEVRTVLLKELTANGIDEGTFYIGPSGAIQGQCFLLLVGGGRAPFSWPSTLAHFSSPEAAEAAIREFISALPSGRPVNRAAVPINGWPVSGTDKSVHQEHPARANQVTVST